MIGNYITDLDFGLEDIKYLMKNKLILIWCNMGEKYCKHILDTIAKTANFLKKIRKYDLCVKLLLQDTWQLKNGQCKLIKIKT